MSHLVGVIGDPRVAMGFRLVGLRPRVAESKHGAAAVLDDMMRDPRWGVVLVQEDFMPDSPPTPMRPGGEGLPILVPVPAPTPEHPPGEAEAYVAELLRRAVGYRVRLR